MLKKSFIVASLSLLLAACGGHGYEGQYESSIEASGLGKMASMMPKTSLYIGTDYIESNGQKINIDKIYVKEQGDKKFLIMQTQQGEQAYMIDKDDSLLIKSGIATIKFTKID